MTIDWVSFTPWLSLGGGILIGLAAAGFVLLNGRIAGVSGVVGGLLQRQKGDLFWRFAFIGGLVTAPLLWASVSDLPPIEVNASLPVVIIAGLLVGIGTRFGSGCTSGHGVCGLSRFSPRSLIATLCFMAAGFGTVYVVRHLVGGTPL